MGVSCAVLSRQGVSKSQSGVYFFFDVTGMRLRSLGSIGGLTRAGHPLARPIRWVSEPITQRIVAIRWVSEQITQRIVATRWVLRADTPADSDQPETHFEF